MYYNMNDHHIRYNTSSKHKKTKTVWNFQYFLHRQLTLIGTLSNFYKSPDYLDKTFCWKYHKCIKFSVILNYSQVKGEN